MGQAKNRLMVYEEAKANLFKDSTAQEKIIIESSISLFERFILPNRYSGGCYLVTMTLHRFFKEEHGIETMPIVGYVNDGTDNIMISHAWLEYQGRKTDLTLNVVDDMGAGYPGALLVMDTPLRSGAVSYSYHIERTPEAIFEIQKLLEYPDTAAIANHKELEHSAMLARVGNPALMEAYLNAAPEVCNYETMASFMR